MRWRGLMTTVPARTRRRSMSRAGRWTSPTGDRCCGGAALSGSRLAPGRCRAGGVDALQTWDDGGGLALYGIGRGSGLVKWDGLRWTALPVYGGSALAVFDDGSGPALYTGAPGRW